MRRDRRGVGGFFEELPAIIIIVIALSIFFISSLYAYGNIVSAESSIRKMSDAKMCAMCIISSKNLMIVKDGVVKERTIDARKLENITGEELSEEINIKCSFRIEIIDVSNYPKNMTKLIKWGEEGEETYIFEYPGVIYVDDDEVHACRIKVSIWID